MGLAFGHRNSRKQGDAGVGEAIAYFTRMGCTVMLPIGECASYDLVVDMDGALKKIQVKTTRCLDRYGRFAVGIRTKGGNKSGETVKFFDKSAVDMLFILCLDGTRYLIPAEAVRGRSLVTLGKPYLLYKLLGP